MAGPSFLLEKDVSWEQFGLVIFIVWQSIVTLRKMEIKLSHYKVHGTFSMQINPTGAVIAQDVKEQPKEIVDLNSQ